MGSSAFPNGSKFSGNKKGDPDRIPQKFIFLNNGVGWSAVAQGVKAAATQVAG